MAIGAGWSRKCKITIDYTLVSATHTNFTVVLDENSFPSEMLDLDGSYGADSTGKDIRFSSDAAGSTELAFDIRGIVLNNNPALSTIEIAVLIPSLSSSVDTDIYVWYSNASATAYAEGDPYGKHNAYRSEYVGVWPLHESQIDDDPFDRTSNSNDGTYNASSSVPIAGKVGYAADFQGTTEYAVISDHSSLDVANVSVAGWYNITDTAYQNKGIFAKWQASGSFILMWDYVTSGKFRMIAKVGGTSYSAVSSNTYSSSDGWVHLCGEYNGSNVMLYINGGAESITGDSASGSMTTGTEDLVIGAYTGGSPYALGDYDEWRMSNAAFGADWNATFYNNTVNISAFASAGTPESAITLKPGIVIFI